MIYPWHEQARQALGRDADRLPNAWLLTGARGIGKTAFASDLAAALLCETPKPGLNACGQCASCHLAKVGNHPDFYDLKPESNEEGDAKKQEQIKIEAVREMLQSIQLTPLRAPRRVVFVHPAESMNIQAANALLKVLEEPSPSVIFILLSHHRDRLLPTIKSRCRAFPLPAPERERALAWMREQKIDDAENLLAFYGGSPLFRESPEHRRLREELLPVLTAPRMSAILDYAADFDRARQPLSLFLNFFDKWLIDVVSVLYGKKPSFYPQCEANMKSAKTDKTGESLFALHDEVIRLVPYGHHTLNVKLAVESLLIDYLKLCL